MGRPSRLPMDCLVGLGPWVFTHGLFFGDGTMMLSEPLAEIKQRIERTGIGLKDLLSVIDMTFEDQLRPLETSSPYEAFKGLNQLIDLTVHGAKIERFRPKDDARPFHTFEIQAEEGETLGYLNMLYLKSFVPCYYLVYVEVMPSFRGLGLGNKILKAFMEFATDRKALGLLDNIILPGENTYEIYTKLGWKAVKNFIRNGADDRGGNYMVFVPDSIQTHDLSEELVKILFSLRKKRPVIDMHDNEDMVKRTVEEFRSVYQTLLQLFNSEILLGASNPLMRFMFTRLTTKLIGFRRRIAALIGYTGGESLEQIAFSDQIKELHIQPYSLWKSEKHRVEIWGGQEILRGLPDKLKDNPTLFIEELPFYKRPYLYDWMKKMGGHPFQPLKISDLLSLGFDPTRLREFHHEGMDYIFERISPHFLSSLVNKRRFLKKAEKWVSQLQFSGPVIRINPPLLILRDRGNIYVLRNKVEGIHSHEALDQLRTSPYLREMNNSVGIDRVMIRVINEIRGKLEKKFNPGFRQEIEDLTYFLPWDIEKNIPRIRVDISAISLDTLWIA
jgi:GNAT superfamily N-acetyltransferase